MRTHLALPLALAAAFVGAACGSRDGGASASSGAAGATSRDDSILEELRRFEG